MGWRNRTINGTCEKLYYTTPGKKGDDNLLRVMVIIFAAGGREKCVGQTVTRGGVRGGEKCAQ